MLKGSGSEDFYKFLLLFTLNLTPVFLSGVNLLLDLLSTNVFSNFLIYFGLFLFNNSSFSIYLFIDIVFFFLLGII